MNQPRVKNWGGAVSNNVGVYVDNGYLQTILGIDEPEGGGWGWDRTRLLREAMERF